VAAGVVVLGVDGGDEGAHGVDEEAVQATLEGVLVGL
jgi:hypothetical protein